MTAGTVTSHRTPTLPLHVRARSSRLHRTDLLAALGWYALTRVVGAVFITRAAHEQVASIWTGPRSDYFDMAQLWDGQWYKIVAEQGYPASLPLGPAGDVQQNAWAFFPGFPMTTKLVMTLTGMPFSPAAVLTNVLLGAAAVVVLLRLLQTAAGRTAGLGGVVLLCAFPAAPALQIAYSESLGLLLLALATWWLVRRSYGWCLVAVLLLSLTRPIVAPFAVVILVHLLVRLYRRREDRLTLVEAATLVGLGVVTALSSLAWPALTGLLLGDPDAYRKTQSAWRTGGVIHPFKQAVDIAHLLWGDRGTTYLVLGAIALVVLVLSPWGRRVGPEMQAWTLAYPGYLLAVTEPWTSTFRYVLLAFPLFAILAVALRFRVLVLALAVLGLVWQQHWVEDLLLFHPPTDYPP